MSQLATFASSFPRPKWIDVASDTTIFALRLFFVALAGSALAQEIPLAPFVIDHHHRVPSPADVSFLLDAPAGRDGFIRVHDGHLVKPNGERLRIWGVNLTGWTKGSTLLPPKEAGAHLGRDARPLRHQLRAISLPRSHDARPAADEAARRVPPASSIAIKITRSRSTREQLDRLDFFVAELKKRGIYTNLNLNVGRTYKEGDGVPDYDVIQHLARG